MSTNQIRRGDIFYADLNPVIGSEQGDTRPVLVVSNNIGNKYSPTIIVIPITSSPRKNKQSTHVTIPYSCGLEVDSIALAEQIRTIDRSRLDSYIGHIGNSSKTAIDKALAVCVGLDRQRSPKGGITALSLCRRCEADFRDGGYVLVKQGWQEVKETCDFCRVHKGLNFAIFDRRK